MLIVGLKPLRLNKNYNTNVVAILVAILRLKGSGHAIAVHLSLHANTRSSPMKVFVPPPGVIILNTSKISQYFGFLWTFMLFLAKGPCVFPEYAYSCVCLKHWS